MKSTDKPQFSKKWWTTEKPADVKGAELEKALHEAETSLTAEKHHSDKESIEACLAALEHVDSAVDKTIHKECDKKKHKDLISVLEKFDDLIKDETKRLDNAMTELEEGPAKDADHLDDEEDESEGKIFEKDYLYKMIKLMRSTGKEINFGFGLNSNAPESSQLLLKRKGKPEMLFKALKKTGTYSNRNMMCGTALADPEDGKVLMFRVEEGDEPPQILKLGRKFLRSDKTLKFRKLKVVYAGGKTLVDNEPDTEDEEQVVASGASAASTTGGESLSAHEQEVIHKILDTIEKRVEKLIAEHQVSV